LVLLTDRLIDEGATVSFADHVIDETLKTTRAEQRDATKAKLVQATIECLVEEGYAALTTRRIAGRAGVAQSTLMHHFGTREELIVEAVTQQALRFAAQALEQIDIEGLRIPKRREAVLDQTWRYFTSPEALAVVNLWLASATDPELVPTLRGIETRLDQVVDETSRALFPDAVDDQRFPAVIQLTYFLIRGLISATPVIGIEAANERWQVFKPVILASVAGLVD
jgi:AcrR family transcriptional regulator